MKRSFPTHLLLLMFCITSLIACSNDDGIASAQDEMEINMDNLSYLLNSENTVFNTTKTYNDMGMAEIRIHARYMDKMNLKMVIPGYTGAKNYESNKQTYMPLLLEVEDFENNSHWGINQETAASEGHYLTIIGDDGNIMNGDFSFKIGNAHGEAMMVKGKFNLGY